MAFTHLRIYITTKQFDKLLRVYANKQKYEFKLHFMIKI